MLHVECTKCHARLEIDRTYHTACPSCGGILDVVVPAAHLRSVAPEVFDAAPTGGIDRFAPLLPVSGPFPWSTLGEGNTPLVECPTIAASYGLERMWVKNEGQNPTGSFKDRPIAVALARAIECGAAAVVTSSSGNAGASVAAYAARAKLPAWVLVPERTPIQNVRQIAAHGARVVRVVGDVGRVFRLCIEVAAALDWTNVSTTFHSPYPTEGNKTVAYEIARQFGWMSPDWIAVPVGSGPLPYGIFKGFVELRALGMVDGLPKMVAVQAAGCCPIVRAFEAGTAVSAWGEPSTVAKGIADPLTGYEQDGDLMLDTIRRSGGTAIAVTDDDILAATRLLARAEGLLAEPTGAVAVAGLRALRSRGTVHPADRAVAVVTGSGLKDLGALSEGTEEPPTIEPSLAQFRAVMEARGSGSARRDVRT